MEAGHRPQATVTTDDIEVHFAALVLPSGCIPFLLQRWPCGGSISWEASVTTVNCSLPR